MATGRTLEGRRCKLCSMRAVVALAIMADAVIRAGRLIGTKSAVDYKDEKNNKSKNKGAGG